MTIIRGQVPKIPTDLEIFNVVYNEYYAAFASWSVGLPNRGTKNYISIDISAIARRIGVDGDIIFGRLYYLHRKKYGYVEVDMEGNEVRVPFFEMGIGKERHMIHFPLMVSVLADLRTEERRVKRTERLSLLALLVSALSVAISIVAFAWSARGASL